MVLLLLCDDESPDSVIGLPNTNPAERGRGAPLLPGRSSIDTSRGREGTLSPTSKDKIHSFVGLESSTHHSAFVGINKVVFSYSRVVIVKKFVLLGSPFP